ncbi:MAG TPA: hypothetical protein RMH99_11405, partial [Sandaracinaceae bacterium LLY-WYZ-13_1]|nr:hypothetical protein [Sandaracinaceae bacterium LLY-WYZ-13_1]
PFARVEVQRVLAAHRHALLRCLERGGVADPITLRVAVRPDGRLVLTSADLPPGVSRHALGCLQRRVSRLSVRGRPERRVTVVHRIGTS